MPRGLCDYWQIPDFLQIFVFQQKFKLGFFSNVRCEEFLAQICFFLKLLKSTLTPIVRKTNGFPFILTLSLSLSVLPPHWYRPTHQYENNKLILTNNNSKTLVWEMKHWQYISLQNQVWLCVGGLWLQDWFLLIGEREGEDGMEASGLPHFSQFDNKERENMDKA